MFAVPSVNQVILLYEKCFISLDLTGLQLITHVLELNLNTRWSTFWCHCWCLVTSSLPFFITDTGPGTWTQFHLTCVIWHTLTHVVEHVSLVGSQIDEQLPPTLPTSFSSICAHYSLLQDLFLSKRQGRLLQNAKGLAWKRWCLWITNRHDPHITPRVQTNRQQIPWSLLHRLSRIPQSQCVLFIKAGTRMQKTGCKRWCPGHHFCVMFSTVWFIYHGWASQLVRS